MNYECKLAQMSNDELSMETMDKIWSSAFFNHINDDSHDQVDKCYKEWIMRDGNASTYKKLHERVRKQHKFSLV